MIMNNAKHTPSPWNWTVPGEMDDDCNIPRVALDWGTWKGKGYGGNPCLTDANGQVIVCAGDGEYMPIRGYGTEQGKANARLIAAAPELYEALQEFVAWRTAAIERPSLCGTGHADYINTLYDKALSALAKVQS